MDNCSPDEYFDTKLLSLNDCKEYERFLKDKLEELNTQYPKEVQQVFDCFQEKPNDEKGDIIDLIQQAKKDDMFPMLMFHTNEEVCKGVFHSIYQQLNDNEEKEYPFHYEILEKKDEFFKNYLKKREIYKMNIKVQSSNPEYEIKEKMEQYDRREKNLFIKNTIEFYQQKIKYIEVNDNDNKKNQNTKILKELSNSTSSLNAALEAISSQNKLLVKEIKDQKENITFP